MSAYRKVVFSSELALVQPAQSNADDTQLNDTQAESM